MARPLWMLVVPGNDDDWDDDHDRDACDHDDCGGGFIDSDEFGCLWYLVMDDHDRDQDDCGGGFICCDDIGLLTFRHRPRRSFGQDTRWKTVS